MTCIDTYKFATDEVFKFKVIFIADNFFSLFFSTKHKIIKSIFVDVIIKFPIKYLYSKVNKNNY
jgi:hypothetical protein